MNQLFTYNLQLDQYTDVTSRIWVLCRHTADGGQRNTNVNRRQTYFQRVKARTETLLKLDLLDCPFSSAKDRRTWVRTDVQHLLCVAGIFPASSAD